jgi:predicted nucleic acid-binding protein
MKAAFADTFFFLAVLNSTDSVHARAAALSREWQTRRVTTAWVHGSGRCPRAPSVSSEI